MDAAILDYGLRAEKSLNQARSDILRPETSSSFLPSFVNGVARFGSVLLLASSVSVATGGITDFDRLPKQLQRDQLSSAREVPKSRQARRISLREARQIALQQLAETENTLREERLAEARFLASFWENDAQDI